MQAHRTLPSSASTVPLRPGAHGFTLIELLVVVAIMALLISLLLPALGRARGLAQMARCGANQRQIYMGFTYYATDYQGKYPTYAGANYGVMGWPGIAFFDDWLAYVMLYTRDATMADATNSWVNTKGIWRCPSNPRLYGNSAWATNYAYNNELAYDFISTIGPLGSPPLWKKSDSLLLVAEAGFYDPAFILPPPRNWSNVQAGYNGRYHVGTWHNGGTYNAVFLDGHVATGSVLPADKQLPGEFFPQWLLWNNRW